ncbi:MAG: efflux RND transporter permease subunit [Bacillota bacterium]|nr:efflux RND transporter permease subunit [Bacillota bacterium]
MSKLILVAIKERKVTILLSIIILFFGVYSYHFIPKQENPDTTSPAAQILTIYPGASATDVENLVTKPIEDVVATLDGIEYIKSFSYDNASIVIVMLNHDVDYDEQWDTLRIGMKQLETELPSGVNIPEMETELTESAGFILSVSGGDYSYSQLLELAKQYKEELNNINGIKKIEIEGEVEKKLIVEIDNEKIFKYDIAISDIYNLIKAQNVVIPSGSIKTESGEINFKVPKSITSQRDVENLIIYISEDNGSVVRLKDIAKVSFIDDDNCLKFRNNGKNAIFITGYFKENKNIVIVGKEVRKTIDKIKGNLPSNLEIDEVLFLPEDVDKSISDFIMNLFQGIVLVVLVVLLGMGRRNSVIVSITIPLSIAITFIVMKILKIDIQQVSIAALIIALGILVDNSIVISDSIQNKINEGKNHLVASFEGAKVEAIPVLSSTLTTIVAFAPLMTLPSEAGEFVKTLPQVVIISLIVSYAVAMLVTPALASKFFLKTDKKKDKLKYIKDKYHKLLAINLNNPYKALGTVIFVFVISLLGIFLIQIKMFPYVDKDIVYFNLNSEVSGDIFKSETLVKSVEKILIEEPEITSISSSIGGGLPRFYMTADIIMPSENKGQVLSNFDLSKSNRFNDREEFAIYLQDRFDKELLGGYCTVNLLEINMPGPAIDVRISGKNIDDVNTVSDYIYEKLANMSGTMNVQNDKGNYSYEYILSIDEDLASSFGLTKYDIQYQINLALSGNVASIMKANGKEYDIKVKSNIDNLEDINNLAIKSQYTNKKILVKQFAKIHLTKQLTAVKRYNRESLVSVSAGVRPEYGISNLQLEIENFINNEIDISGVKISYGGDSETITKYLAGLVSAGLIALIFVYIILLIQFNSLKQPVIILATIPLAFIGVIIALLVTKTHFTFTVGLGIASLFGIVVNNAILLIEYINRARKEGMNVKEACVDSVEKRMRPILLSSITTIFGLVPLVRAQSSFFTPMAIGLIGGLLISTILTLTVIPTIYYIIER